MHQKWDHIKVNIECMLQTVDDDMSAGPPVFETLAPEVWTSLALPDHPSTRLVRTSGAKVSKTGGASQHISINLSTFYLTLASVVLTGAPHSAGRPLPLFSVMVLSKYLIKAMLGLAT